jgi:hypothetical protein
LPVETNIVIGNIFDNNVDNNDNNDYDDNDDDSSLVSNLILQEIDMEQYIATQIAMSGESSSEFNFFKQLI